MDLAPEMELQPFHAMEILARAKQLEREGREILHLEVGEPAAPPAPRVLEAVRRVLPSAQKYTHAKGDAALREALAGQYLRDYGLSVDPEAILVTMGSSAGFILAFSAAFRPGERIAMTRPGYPGTLNALLGLGYRSVDIPLGPANGWRLTGDAIRRAHAEEPFEGLVFASPSNPTGAAVDGGGLGEIVASCLELGIVLISDEIYHGLDYRGRSESALEHTRDAFVINSFSKYHCMTGWRIGWLVVPERYQRRAEMLAQNLFISAPTLSQVAALAALGETDYAETQKSHYAANRTRLSEGLRNLGFGIAEVPDGAFYAYADVGRFTNDSLRFCKQLLEVAGVAATPGIDFDRVEGHRYVRFSYAGESQVIEQALERTAAFLRGL